MSLLEATQVMGNVGEFVGAIAVVVTLAYLAVQIRRNTRATQASINLALRSECNRIHEAVLTNPELLEVMERLGNPGDDHRARSFANYWLNVYSAVDTAEELGTFPPGQFDDWKTDMERTIKQWPGCVGPMREIMDHYPALAERQTIMSPLGVSPADP